MDQIRLNRRKNLVRTRRGYKLEIPKKNDDQKKGRHMLLFRSTTEEREKLS